MISMFQIDQFLLNNAIFYMLSHHNDNGALRSSVLSLEHNTDWLLIKENALTFAGCFKVITSGA